MPSSTAGLYIQRVFSLRRRMLTLRLSVVGTISKPAVTTVTGTSHECETQNVIFRARLLIRYDQAAGFCNPLLLVYVPNQKPVGATERVIYLAVFVRIV